MSTTDRRPKIHWQTSAAKALILKDLVENNISRSLNAKDHQYLWEHRYRNRPEFKYVTYKQFCANLPKCRGYAIEDLERSAQEEAAMIHDLGLHPRRTHNSRGEKKFDRTPAQQKLRNLVKEKQHEGVKPAALRQAHPEFQEFRLDKFRQRIYQEQRYQRRCNFQNDKARVDEKKHLIRIEGKKVAKDKERQLWKEVRENPGQQPHRNYEPSRVVPIGVNYHRPPRPAEQSQGPNVRNPASSRPSAGGHPARRQRRASS